MDREKSLKAVLTLLWIAAVLMTIIIPGNDTLLKTLAVFIAITVLCILAYNSRDREFRSALFGIPKESLVRSVVWGTIFGFGFFVILKVFGLSIGIPKVPGAISDTIRSIIVLGFAPVLETIFFQSVVYALVLTRTKSKLFAFVGQAAVMSAAHIGAYVLGFYSYPNFVSGLEAVQANLGSFFAVFLFASTAMWYQQRKSINSLGFSMTFHFWVNFIVTVSFIVIGGLSLT